MPRRQPIADRGMRGHLGRPGSILADAVRANRARVAMPGPSRFVLRALLLYSWPGLVLQSLCEDNPEVLENRRKLAGSSAGAASISTLQSRRRAPVGHAPRLAYASSSLGRRKARGHNSVAAPPMLDRRRISQPCPRSGDFSKACRPGLSWDSARSGQTHCNQGANGRESHQWQLPRMVGFGARFDTRLMHLALERRIARPSSVDFADGVLLNWGNWAASCRFVAHSVHSGRCLH